MLLGLHVFFQTVLQGKALLPWFGPLKLIVAAVRQGLLKFFWLAQQLRMLTWLFLDACNGLPIIADCRADNRAPLMRT